MHELQQFEQQVGSLSLEFVEGLLADYLHSPDSVSPDWRNYFDEMTRGQESGVRGQGSGTGNGDCNGNGRSLSVPIGESLAPRVSQIGRWFRPASLFAPWRRRTPSTTP